MTDLALSAVRRAAAVGSSAGGIRTPNTDRATWQGQPLPNTRDFALFLAKNADSLAQDRDENWFRIRQKTTQPFLNSLAFERDQREGKDQTMIRWFYGVFRLSLFLDTPNPF
jgi:hypothetical protein